MLTWDYKKRLWDKGPKQIIISLGSFPSLSLLYNIDKLYNTIQSQNKTKKSRDEDNH